MLQARHILQASIRACTCCLVFCVILATPARAAEPATVTVRVEGATHTLLPPTVVTTNTAAVIKDGNPADSCPGTAPIGALELATHGNWTGTWFKGFGYSVEALLGESHLFAENSFWEFWYDNKPAPEGICGTEHAVELKNGDSLLFFPECAEACSAPPNPLGIQAPATAAAGAEVPVTVTSYANASGAPSPAQGATVSYEGTSAATDASGHATLRFAHAGQAEVTVTAPQSLRTEATICIHAGEDGTCGTSKPGSTSTQNASPGTTAPAFKGLFAIVAALSSVRDNHHYARGAAPRLLAGSVRAHTAVTGVSLELRRAWHGRCWAYDGVRQRFVRARCGVGKPFAVGTSSSFSYLLPAPLAPGRYVLDVSGSDATGNTIALARGSSRVVFYVR